MKYMETAENKQLFRVLADTQLPLEIVKPFDLDNNELSIFIEFTNGRNLKYEPESYDEVKIRDDKLIIFKDHTVIGLYYLGTILRYELVFDRRKE